MPSKKAVSSTMPNKKDAIPNVHVTDFGRSPLRFEYDVLLEEYRAMRTELDAHLAHQHQVINYALTVLAAGVALSQFTTLNPSLVAVPSRLLFLLGSIIFSSFCLIYLWHDTSVAFLAAFITHVLRPKLENIIVRANGVQQSVLLWDEFLSKNRMRNPFSSPVEYGISLGRYAITVLPSMGLLLGYLFTNNRPAVVSTVEAILLVITLFAAFLVVTGCVYTSWLFIFDLPSSARKKWKQP